MSDLNDIMREYQRRQSASSPVINRAVFGSDPLCHHVVNDPHASPQHCEFRLHANGVVSVVDLGSTNTTTVRRTGEHWARGKRAYSAIRVGPGYTVRIGRTDFIW